MESLICGEGIDGTCEYIFVSKGRRGVYDVEGNGR